MTTQTKNTTNATASNNLQYNIAKVIKYGGENATIYVKIRLNDECKNGHQDFAITADIYKNGVKNDRNFMAGGCMHEEILKHFPKFEIFVNLHLCDFDGVPMYPTANGFYHLKNGFNSTKPEAPEFAHEYCKYYRITPAQFQTLKTAENEVIYAYYLHNLGILEQWKTEAKKAIKILEGLTGCTFLNDSKRSQLVMPAPEIIEAEKEKIKNGYYSPEKIRARKYQAQKAAKTKIKAELKADLEKTIKTAKIEFEAKNLVLDFFGTLKNFIHYSHTNTFGFNWLDYEPLHSSEKIADFEKFIWDKHWDKLPVGIKFTNEGKGK